MDIYKNGVLLLKIPNSIKRTGFVRTRLTGFNLFQTPESFELQAVYKSLVGRTVSDGITIIDIVLGERNLSIFVFSRFPFVSFSLGNPTKFEDEK